MAERTPALRLRDEYEADGLGGRVRRHRTAAMEAMPYG